jgi:hypothetical protein
LLPSTRANRPGQNDAIGSTVVFCPHTGGFAEGDVRIFIAAPAGLWGEVSANEKESGERKTNQTCEAVLSSSVMNDTTSVPEEVLTTEGAPARLKSSTTRVNEENAEFIPL